MVYKVFCKVKNVIHKMTITITIKTPIIGFSFAPMIII